MRIKLLLHGTDMELDDGEGLPELVVQLSGDMRRLFIADDFEPPGEGAHLFAGPLLLRLGLVAGGDVPQDGGIKFPTAHLHLRDRSLDGEFPAIRAQAPDGSRRAHAATGSGDSEGFHIHRVPRAEAGGDQASEGLTEHLRGVPAEHSLCGGVHTDDCLGCIYSNNGVHRRIDEAVELGLFVAQALFPDFPLGDVHMHDHSTRAPGARNRSDHEPEPTLLVRAVAGILESETKLMAAENRAQSGSHRKGLLGAVARRTFTDIDVILADEKVRALGGVGLGKCDPLVIDGDDVAKRIDQGDLGGQRIENRLIFLGLCAQGRMELLNFPLQKRLLLQKFADPPLRKGLIRGSGGGFRIGGRILHQINSEKRSCLGFPAWEGCGGYAFIPEYLARPKITAPECPAKDEFGDWGWGDLLPDWMEKGLQS